MHTTIFKENIKSYAVLQLNAFACWRHEKSCMSVAGVAMWYSNDYGITRKSVDMMFSYLLFLLVTKEHWCLGSIIIPHFLLLKIKNSSMYMYLVIQVWLIVELLANDQCELVVGDLHIQLYYISSTEASFCCKHYIQNVAKSIKDYNQCAQLIDCLPKSTTPEPLKAHK